MMPCPYQGWGAIEKCCNKKQRGQVDPSQFSQLIRLIYALLLGRVEQTPRSPQPPLKKGGESPQIPPVLLEVLGKLSLHPCIRALFKGDARGIFLSLSAITSSLLHTP